MYLNQQLTKCLSAEDMELEQLEVDMGQLEVDMEQLEMEMEQLEMKMEKVINCLSSQGDGITIMALSAQRVN